MYRRTTLVALLISLACATARAEDDALLKRGIEKLFDVGWDTSVKSRSAADEVAAKIDELFPGDARGTYAYALVLSKQRRYADAAEQFKEVVERRPEDIAAWQAKIRLSMLTKEYAVALADLEQLSRLVPTPGADSAAGSRYRDIAVFAGRMIGYLEGPAENGVGGPLLATTKKNVIEAIGDDLLPAFQDGRRRVREKFSSLKIEKEETEVSEKATAEAERNKLLQDIETERSNLDPTRAELRDDRDKIRSETQEELAELSEEERPLVEQLARLDAQAMLVRRERAIVFDNVSRLSLALNRERDPIVRGQLVIELDRIRRFGNRYDTELRLLERRAAAINTQRLALRRGAQQARAGTVTRLNEIDEELEGLEKKEKRLAVQEKKGLRAPTGRTRIVRLLEAEIAAFSTYDELPLEIEKQRLLDGFVD